MIPDGELAVVHYTLGPLKPWSWWAAWLIRVSDEWRAVRRRLPADADGRTGGRSARQDVAERLLTALPPLLYAAAAAALRLRLAALAARGRGKAHGGGAAAAARGLPSHHHGDGAASGRGERTPSPIKGAQLCGGSVVVGGLRAPSVSPRRAGAAGPGGACAVWLAPGRAWGSVLVGYALAGAAAGVVLAVVPPEVDPLYGYLLSAEWGLGAFLGGFYCYLAACRARGARRPGGPGAGKLPGGGGGSGALPPLQLSGGRGPAPPQEPPWRRTAAAAAAGSALLMAAPFAGDILGVQGFAARIGATCAAAVLLAAFATVNFVVLPARWHAYGEWTARHPDAVHAHTW